MLRDEDGRVISSGYGKLETVLEPLRAEIIACLQALQRAAELGVQRLILATDAIAGLQAATSLSLDRSSACGLIWELKDLLVSNFVSSTVSHDHRLSNSVAHGLASLGAGMVSGPTSVRDVMPSCIQVLVANGLAPSDE